jgi:hypothetical protein
MVTVREKQKLRDSEKKAGMNPDLQGCVEENCCGVVQGHTYLDKLNKSRKNLGRGNR